MPFVIGAMTTSCKHHTAAAFPVSFAETQGARASGQVTRSLSF